MQHLSPAEGGMPSVESVFIRTLQVTFLKKQVVKQYKSFPTQNMGWLKYESDLVMSFLVWLLLLDFL